MITDAHKSTKNINTTKVLGKTSSADVVVYTISEKDPLFGTRNYTKEGIFTGLKYECVEFARRFLIERFGVTFAEVRSATDIANLLTFQPVTPKSLHYERYTEFPMYRFKPHPFITMPHLGDLLIFKVSDINPHGHVAVVIHTSLHPVKEDTWLIYFCDQNFNDVQFQTDHNGFIEMSISSGKNNRVRLRSDRGSLSCVCRFLQHAVYQ